MSEKCPFDKNTPAKCANCEGNHTANYRGCIVVDKKQSIRDQFRQGKPFLDRNNKTKNTAQQLVQQEQKKSEINTQSSSQEVKTTYSQVAVKKDGAQSVPSSDNKILENLIKSIESLRKELDEQNKINKLIFDQLKKLQSTNRKANNKKSR